MSSTQRQYGLDQSVIRKIQSALSDFPQISSAILYGSRAKGNFRNGSDIDLTLKTDGDDSLKLLIGVMDALDDLDLIYRFDISLLSETVFVNKVVRFSLRSFKQFLLFGSDLFWWIEPHFSDRTPVSGVT